MHIACTGAQFKPGKVDVTILSVTLFSACLNSALVQRCRPVHLPLRRLLVGCIIVHCVANIEHHV